jgi:hypothetical protein
MLLKNNHKNTSKFDFKYKIKCKFKISVKSLIYLLIYHTVIELDGVLSNEIRRGGTKVEVAENLIGRQL